MFVPEKFNYSLVKKYGKYTVYTVFMGYLSSKNFISVIPLFHFYIFETIYTVLDQ